MQKLINRYLSNHANFMLANFNRLYLEDVILM